MKKLCSIDNCNRPARSRGWCERHYGRWIRGAPLTPLSPRARARRKILSNISVDLKTGCWLWLKCRNPAGYGVTGFRGKTHMAHRVSWTVFNGEIPQGKCILHKCDDPQCVNPDHLFIGTRSDNIKDKVAKGRQAKGEATGRTPLTKEDVLGIVADSRTQLAIGEDYGINQRTVSQIKLGKRWGHVTGIVRA